MRISISGTQCIGKTTFINDFKKKWNMYISPKRTFRDVAHEQNLKACQEGTEESQRIIRDACIDEIMDNKDNDHVIFDQSIWDNLAYTMWLNANGKVSDSFVKETITLCRETLVFLDIVFFLPITKYSPVKIEDPEIDPVFRNEIDVLFKSLMDAYTKQSNVYYPISEDLGCPAIIELFGTPEQRVQLAQFYLNDDGDIYGEKDTLIDPSQLDDTGKELAREVFSPR